MLFFKRHKNKVLKLLRCMLLLACIILGEYGNLEYHMGFEDMPNDKGGARVLTEDTNLERKRQSADI